MISKVPARICLFGDHQDYLGLPVIACAIDKYIIVEGKPNHSNFLNFNLKNLEKKISIDLNDNLKDIKKGDHIKFVLKSLKKNKIVINKGFDIKIKSEIFINAGISSSSAIVVALINFFLQTFIGKFILIGITWSFSFQILSEIRHLIMVMGYGFELQTTKITGLLVIFGSIILTILIYLSGRGII